MSRAMKDSGVAWIGEIPEKWKVLPAQRVFTEIKKKNTDGAIQKALQFKFGSIIPKTNFSAEDDEYVSGTITTYTVVEPGTVMINGLNLNYDFVTQRTGLVRETGVITSAYLALSPNRNMILPEFATYLFKGYETRMALHNMGSGIRLTLGYKEIKKQPVLLPSLFEQQLIVGFIDRRCAEIDRVIAATQRTIEEYKKLKQSIITEAVTRGIRPSRNMKDSGVEWIGEIPDEWSVVGSRFIIDQIGDVDHYMPMSVEQGYPYVMTGDLKHNLSSIDFDECKKVSPKDYEALCNKITCSIGDVIFARYATIGTVCYVDVNIRCVISYSCVIIKPNKAKLMGKFLYYYLQSSAFSEDIRQYIKSNTQENVGIEALFRTRLPISSIAEQIEISDFLDFRCAELDRLINAKQQLLTQLEAFKKSVIYEYVTGKKEVPA